MISWKVLYKLRIPESEKLKTVLELYELEIHQKKIGPRTKARVAWNVVLCCSNRASICSLALILLSQTRWIVMPCLCTSISLKPFVQTRLICGSWSAYMHQSPAFSFKHVWVVIPCLSASISLQPCVPNTFGLWLLVCVHASVNSPLFQTRLIVVACLLTSISLEPKWLRLTWIIPCKCLVFCVVRMVMGTSTVA